MILNTLNFRVPNGEHLSIELTASDWLETNTMMTSSDCFLNEIFYHFRSFHFNQQAAESMFFSNFKDFHFPTINACFLSSVILRRRKRGDMEGGGEES
jgi:hypothetical protein